MKFGFLFFILSIVSTGWALSYDVPLVAGDRLVIEGFEAQIIMTNNPSMAGKIRISGIDDSQSTGSYVLERLEKEIHIRRLDFENRKEWQESIVKKTTKGKKIIEIQGTPVPVEVYLHSGQIQLSKWTKDVRATLQQGKFVSQQGQGDTQIFLRQGEVSVQEQSGPLKISAYNAQVNVKSHMADLDVSLFQGNLLVEKGKGVVNLNVHNTTSKLVKWIGNVQLENGKGSVSLNQHQGRIEGQTAEGSVYFQVLNDSDVHFKSQAGKVQVQLPPASGAWLSLYTQDGEILIPSEIKVARGATEKSARGHLSGEGKKINVVVRSVEGTIVVK